MENNQEKKQTVLSLIQPTGTPTLGNYLGALKIGKICPTAYDCFSALRFALDNGKTESRGSSQKNHGRCTLFYWHSVLTHTKTRCLFRATFPLMHSLRGFLTAIPNSERLQE